MKAFKMQSPLDQAMRISSSSATVVSFLLEERIVLL